VITQSVAESFKESISTEESLITESSSNELDSSPMVMHSVLEFSESCDNGSGFRDAAVTLCGNLSACSPDSGIRLLFIVTSFSAGGGGSGGSGV
jgi:hypothetical protein